MIRHESFYIVAYDIADDARRMRVAKILEDFGDRVQYSVFEMVLQSEQQLARLKRRLLAVIDDDSDSIRIYSLCAGCRTSVEILGQGETTNDKDFYVV